MIITVHSFVDLITNSSSEVFLCADANAAEGIRKIIDAVLKAANSTCRCDDMFNIEVLFAVRSDNGWSRDVEFVPEAEFNSICEKWEACRRNKTPGVSVDRKPAVPSDYDDVFDVKTKIRVTAKDTSSENQQKAAELLASIEGYFSAHEIRN